MTEIIIPDSVYSGILQDNNISSSITSDKSLVEKDKEVKEKKINIPTNISKDIIIPQTVYEFNGNKIADKPLGTRIKNEKGKYKVKLFSL